MKRILVLLLLGASCTWAQTVSNAAVTGYCEQGGANANVSGLNSVNYLQGIIPSCTITVYLTGTQNLATIYNASGSQIANPFTANAATSVAPGQYTFYAPTSTALDVTGSGGIAPNTYPSPVPLLTDYTPGGGGGADLLNTPNSWTNTNDIQLANITRSAFQGGPFYILGTNDFYLWTGSIPGTSQYNFGRLFHYNQNSFYLDSTPGCWGFEGGPCNQTEHDWDTLTMYVAGGGGTNVHGMNASFYSVGDHIGNENIITSFGGSIDAGGPEGTKGWSNFVGEPANTWTGAVASGHGGVGQTLLTATCSTDCGSGPNYGLNGGTPASVGQGLWVTDEQATTASGQIESFTQGSGEIPGTITVNITGGLSSLAVSTCEATLTTSLSPTPNPSGSGSQSLSFTVNVVTGTCVAGGLMSFAGTNHEQALITSVTAPSGGQQTITANIRLYHEATSYVFENANSDAGLFGDIVANDTNGLKFPIEILGVQSISGSTAVMWWRYWYAGSQPGFVGFSVPAGRMAIGSGAVGTLSNSGGTVSFVIYQNYNFAVGWQSLNGASAIYISGASNAAFDGPCTNVSISFPSGANPGTGTCTQAASTGDTATGANVSLTDSTLDNPYGNSRINFYQGAAILDPQDYSTPIVVNGVTSYPVDGLKFSVEPNQMLLNAGDALVEHHGTPQFHAQADSVGVQQPGCYTCDGWQLNISGISSNGGSAFNNKGIGINNTAPLSQYQYFGGTMLPPQAYTFQGLFSNLIYTALPPTIGGSIINVSSCPASGCTDPTYNYNVFSLAGNNAISTMTYFPAINTFIWKGQYQVQGTFNLGTASTPLLLNNSPGSAGQCVVSNGAGVTPSWGTCGSGGGISSFSAPSGSWPTWLVPTVTNPTTTPSLTVAASAIPNAALANSSITLGSTAVSLGGTISSATGLSITGNAGTATALSTTGSNGTVWGVSGGTQQWVSVPSGVTWPATNDLVISNSTNSPPGLAPVNGDCVVGSGGVWTAGSCSGSGGGVTFLNGLSGSINVTLGTQNTVLTGAAGKVNIPTSFLQVDAVNDLGLDNTGGSDVSGPLSTYISTMPAHGVKIVFPCGVYRFASQLTIAATASTKESLYFYGTVPGTLYGTSCVQFEGQIANGDLIEYNNTSAGAGQQNGPFFENIQFVDTSSGSTSMRSGLHIVQANDTILKNITFQNFSGNNYSTGTVTISSSTPTTVTGSGTSWTSAMAGPNGMFCYGGYCQEIASVNSSTSITLVNAWQGAEFGYPSGSSYDIDYNGVGVLLDPGNASSGFNFAQYAEWQNVGALNTRITVATAGSNNHLYGVSRITIVGGRTNCQTLPDSMYSFWGGYTDTMVLIGVAENNCTWFSLSEDAHANRWIAPMGENASPFPQNITCGAASQACTRGIEINGTATNEAYGNVITGAYFNLVGNQFQIDTDSILRTTISATGSPASVNTNDYEFLTTGNGYQTTDVKDWELFQTNAPTVQFFQLAGSGTRCLDVSSTGVLGVTTSACGSATGGFPITIGLTSIGSGSTTTTIAGLTLTSPTFTSPALGTPASGVITNLTGTCAACTASAVANGLTANSSGTGAASPSTFTGSAALTWSYNTFGASPLAGSASLVTLGTVTSGTWNATAIGTQYGGTGQNWSSSSGIPELAAGTASLFNTSCSGASNALTWNSTTHAIGCNTISVSSVALSSITAATGSNTIANGNNPQVWNWAQTTNAQTAFTFGETSAATGTTNTEVAITTLAGSTAIPLVISDSLSGSQTLPALKITPTWNTTGVVDAALLVNVTNTASGTGSLLMDLQVGGVSQFSVDKAGNATALGAITSTPPAGDAGMFALPGNTANQTIPANQFAIGGFNSASATAYGWQPSTTAPSGTQFMMAGTPSSGWSAITYESTVTIAQGGTNAATAATALSNLLGNPAAGTYAVTCSSGTSCTTSSSPGTLTIASGTATLGTSAIASGACATVVTATATGGATTDVIQADFNADPTAITGYGASATGAVLTIYKYVTANTANFKVCNSTASSITPGSATLNWRITR